MNVDMRPPAAAGDLLALIGLPPCTIVLIDGVFDDRASVQHKEILELLARGFRVIGGASMGALRAAELHPCGMAGVGAIFAAYAAGRITADDEVAVLHAPAELGFRPLTEALVDIRATLAAAVRARILQPSEARMLRSIARTCFWRERTWGSVLDAARAALGGQMVERLAAWLPANRVHLKSRDAAMCIAAARSMRAPMPTIAPPPRTTFFLGLAKLVDVGLEPVLEGTIARAAPSTR